MTEREREPLRPGRTPDTPDDLLARMSPREDMVDFSPNLREGFSAADEALRISPEGRAVGGELLPSGDFETDTDVAAWTALIDTVLTAYTADAIRGQRSLLISHPLGLDATFETPRIKLQPRQVYVIDGWFKNLGPEDAAILRVDVYRETPTFKLLETRWFRSKTGWSYFNVRFLTPPVTDTVYAQFYVSSDVPNGTQTYLVDAVSLRTSPFISGLHQSETRGERLTLNANAIRHITDQYPELADEQPGEISWTHSPGPRSKSMVLDAGTATGFFDDFARIELLTGGDSGLFSRIELNSPLVHSVGNLYAHRGIGGLALRAVSLPNATVTATGVFQNWSSTTVQWNVPSGIPAGQQFQVVALVVGNCADITTGSTINQVRVQISLDNGASFLSSIATLMACGTSAGRSIQQPFTAISLQSGTISGAAVARAQILQGSGTAGNSVFREGHLYMLLIPRFIDP